MDRDGAPAMLNCLMYKMSYYRFGEVYTEGNKPAGWDRYVPGPDAGNLNPEGTFITV